MIKFDVADGVDIPKCSSVFRVTFTVSPLRIQGLIAFGLDLLSTLVFTQSSNGVFLSI